MHWLGITALALSACGRVGFDASDALVGDGGDGGLVESSMVEVVGYHVVQGMGLQEGALVWSNRRDGTVDDVARTDAAGRARLRVEAGGTVSMFDSVGLWFETVAAVEPGDILTFGPDTSPCGDTAVHDVEVAWAPVAGAASYEVIAGCSSVSVIATQVTLGPPVLAPSSLDLVLRAYDDAGQLLASATRANASLAPGAMHTITAADWRPGTTVEVGLANLPANTLAAVSVMLWTASASAANADAYTVDTAVSASGDVRATRVVPADAMRMTIAALTEDPLVEGNGVMAILVDVPLGIGTALSAPPVADSATWNASTGELSWSLADAGSADSIDTIVVLDGLGPTPLFWTARVPPDVRSLAIPMFPPELVLDIAAAELVAAYVITGDFDDAVNYREARRFFNAYWMILAATDNVPILQHSGSFAVRFLVPDEG